MLSRTKPAVGPGSGNTVSSAKDSKKKRKLPKTEEFLQMRDFTGAITLLEVSFIDVNLGIHTSLLGWIEKYGKP